MAYILGFPLLAVTLLIGSIVSFRRRLCTNATLRPSLVVRRWLVIGLTLAAVAGHLWSWWLVRPVVPAGAKPGTVIYGGPGDGLWFALAILGPWMWMQLVNVAMALYCSRAGKQAALAGTVLLLTWVAAALVGAELGACPAGMICRSG